MNTDQIMDGVLIWKAIIKVLIWKSSKWRTHFKGTLYSVVSTISFKI